MKFFDFNNSGDRPPNDKKFVKFTLYNGHISGLTISAELAQCAGLKNGDRVLLGYDPADKKFGIVKTRRDDFAGCELRAAATNSNTLRTIGAMPFFRHHADMPIISDRMPGFIENDNGKMICFHCDAEKAAQWAKNPSLSPTWKEYKVRIDEPVMTRFRLIVRRREWSATIQRLMEEFLAGQEASEEPPETEDAQDAALYMNALEDAVEETGEKTFEDYL